MILVLPFFYQNYGQFEYFFRFTGYIYMPLIFLLGSSGKISNILPSFKFNDPRSLYYFISNIIVMSFGIFLVFYFLMSSDLYKHPSEILNVRNIDYVDGDAHLFIEMKMIFFLFVFTKINFRFLHRVGPPFGQGICFNLRHIIIISFELFFAALFIVIFFLDNIFKNEKF